MSHSPNDIEASLDVALGSILATGWDDPVGEATARVRAPAVPEPQPPVENVATARQYPPVPVREHLEPQPHGGALKRSEALPPRDPDDEGGRVSIGLLTELATGRKTAAEVASVSGITTDQLQADLATALREVPAEEIAKAMGMQAAEQQLKSGALYGLVVSELTQAMMQGRMKYETMLDFAKMLARNGKVEPKEDKGVAQGSGFVLNIQMNGAGPQPVTIDAN